MKMTLITSAVLMSALATPTLAQDAPAATTTTTTETPVIVTTTDATAPAATTTTTTTAAASFPGANGAQIKAGDTIYDPAGEVVGTVKSVDATAATVSTGMVTVALPLTGIGPAPKGLVIALTKAQVEAQAKAATPTG